MGEKIVCAAVFGARREGMTMKKQSLCVALAFCGMLILSGGRAAPAQTIRAVKADATGANTGLSWTDAFPLLESALAVSQPGDEIWIAAGTYYPTAEHGLGIGSRYRHFELKPGVRIYGGFDGTESGRGQRDPELNVTILSGDIGTAGQASDNCYHVLYHPAGLPLDDTAILDGVTITGGNANAASAPNNRGGGMHNISSSPHLTDCIFTDNAADDNGGGMYNDASSPRLDGCEFNDNTAEGDGAGMCNNNSSPNLTDCVFSGNASTDNGAGMSNNNSASPTLTSCEFSGNTSTADGGAMYNNSSSPTLRECAFSGNSAQYGGGVCNFDHASPTLRNCVFSGNDADVSGGGIYNFSHSAPVLTNCSFGENAAGGFGGGIYSDSSAPVLRNCILWGDTAPTGPEVRNANTAAPEFRYCDVDGSGGSGAWDAGFGTDDGGNIDADPLFADAAGDNLHLQGGSPCIDAADGDLAPSTDKDGNHRFDDPDTVNTGVGNPDYADIGAFEFQLVAVTYPSDSGIGVEVGKAVEITWISSLPSSAKMRIELVKGGVETWELSPGASKGKFKWKVGKWKSKTQAVYPDDDDYRIRISTLDDNYSDESDNDFAIGRVTSLTVSGPADVTGGALPLPQYDATAHYNSGIADRDVTGEVKWSCSKIKGVKIKIAKGGVLTTPPVLADLPCTITAAYGKEKPPVSDELDITISAP